MKGVNITQVVSPEWFKAIKEAQFINLIVRTENGDVQEMIKLYPAKYVEDLCFD